MTSPEAMRRRVVAVLALCMLVFGVIAWKLVSVQALDGEEWRARALDQRDTTVDVKAERGAIFDRSGLSLAMTVQRDLLFADTTPITDPARYANLLAPLIGADTQELYAQLVEARQGERPDPYVVLARQLEPDVVDQITELQDDHDLVGLGFAPDPVRVYPARDLAASVLGTTEDGAGGSSGLELAYDRLLRGEDGQVTFERGRDGTARIPRTQRTETPVRPGDDLELTLDASLQYMVERSLLDQVTAQRAMGGMAAVVDVKTGSILAMATVEADAKGSPGELARYNRLVTDVFEPGSTNKVIPISAALDAGVIDPDTPLAVEQAIRIGDHTYTDDESHGSVAYTPAQIVQHSSNVGTIKIARALGASSLDASFRAFGLGQRTPLNFKYEAEGVLPLDYQHVSTAAPSASIGYGLSVTALQMLNVYTTLANGGRAVAPRILNATIDDDGNRTEMPVQIGNQVVSEATAARMSAMLTNVVRSGTAPCAAIPGYEVAGKTGTARKVLESGEYGEDRTMATFVGYAPASAPRLSAIVVLDEPDDIYGGRAAAPVFSEIMQYALGIERVPADSIAPGVTPQWDDAAALAERDRLSCAVPHGSALAASVAATPVDAAPTVDPESTAESSEPSEDADAAAPSGTDETATEAESAPAGGDVAPGSSSTTSATSGAPSTTTTTPVVPLG